MFAQVGSLTLGDPLRPRQQVPSRISPPPLTTPISSSTVSTSTSGHSMAPRTTHFGNEQDNSHRTKARTCHPPTKPLSLNLVDTPTGRAVDGTTSKTVGCYPLDNDEPRQEARVDIVWPEIAETGGEAATIVVTPTERSLSDMQQNQNEAQQQNILIIDHKTCPHTSGATCTRVSSIFFF